MTQLIELDTSDDASGDNQGWSAVQILVVGTCFLVNMIDGMDVLILSYVAPALAADWSLEPSHLGVVFSAGLVGMAIGGLFVAPLADRFGRRPLILLALALMSIGMIASGWSRAIVDLLIFRTLVGVGIGTVLASMAAITAEYAPGRYRNFAVGLLQAGYPIGATLVGFIAAWALPLYGWRTMLTGTGIVSVAVVVAVFILLPESTEFLKNVQPKGALHKINRIYAKMGRQLIQVLPERTLAEKSGIAVAQLLAGTLLRSSLLLWASIFSGYMVLYFIVSWIPKLAIEAGLDVSNAIFAGAIYNVGAFVGTVGLSFLATYLNLQRMIFGFMVAAAAVLLCFGGISMPVALVLVTAFVLGLTLQGGFNGLYPLAARVYPAEIRSTGLGWAMGIGRGGAVLGPLLGGYLLGIKLPLIYIFGVFAAPLIVTGSCAIAIRLLPDQSRHATSKGEADPRLTRPLVRQS